MLRAFQDINADMERTGELVAAMAKGELLKMVARNNVMRTGILSSKIGLTKRFDAAWRDAECSRIYEHLREEMEITRRYEDLEVKVRRPCITPTQGLGDVPWPPRWARGQAGDAAYDLSDGAPGGGGRQHEVRVNLSIGPSESTSMRGCLICAPFVQGFAPPHADWHHCGVLHMDKAVLHDLMAHQACLAPGRARLKRADMASLGARSLTSSRTI